MRILIINPNSSPEMTRDIQDAALAFAGDAFEVQTVTNPDAPRFIETYGDEARAAPGMVRILQDHEAEYDAFVIACHCDPNLDLLKETTDRPVVGIGEASMKLASMLGHRFSVVSATRQSIPNKEALVRKYHLQDALASVRAYPGTEATQGIASTEGDGRGRGREDAAESSDGAMPDAERYLAAARAAIDEDGAEVIVLGCAGMAGLDKRLQAELGVPVLDGVVCGLIVASGLAAYGVSTSKIRRYRGDG